MFTTFRAKSAIVLIALLIPALLSASSAEAQELVISGNGSSSDSQIQTTITSTTTIQQSNQADIQNDVQLDANTGENSTSDNTNADTQIQTGDINTQVSTENSTNISTVSLDCCPEPESTIAITGNGTDSQNSVDFNQNSDTQINIYQNAYIQNNVTGSANTGGNQANDNTGGDISITTGNIYANLEVENKNINSVNVSAPQANGNVNIKQVCCFAIKIAGNGSYSNNLASISLNNNVNISIDNRAEVINSAIWDLITGGNQASGNTGGNVYIATGDINFTAEIINGPINTSLVTIDCCDSVDDPGDPAEPDDPDDPTGGPAQSSPPPSANQPPSSSSTSPGPGSSPSNGQVLAAMAAGQILPATGVSWTIILTLVSLIMFMLGLYLRRHPGQDPGKVVTHV
ncbi:hypothetical protein A2867_00030 [Candidatus Daviesbacteria bacterium RIFCSPHIGHO2_01_FULL_40_11]|uniref:Gram-positive cocci surface proteins LPxTG domain-containing protein n=1 Tax=Candidatus Daviesbacteria bacterium RIFCSPHIGHO2_01_FULL_40_11 TaxID=1797762 RepID=A0A1F5JL43_9BACT|nr:MAG: hypothetical protein A2867_00030 [Candidatus Daviesbacteria bacterium RIFCSPHIGHO2_01_FULL_40_11]